MRFRPGRRGSHEGGASVPDRPLWRQVAHARQVGRCRASARARRSFCGRSFTYSLPSTKNTTFPPSTNTPPAKPTTALIREGGSSAPARVNSRTRPRFSFPATFSVSTPAGNPQKRGFFASPGPSNQLNPKISKISSSQRIWPTHLSGYSIWTCTTCACWADIPFGVLPANAATRPLQQKLASGFGRQPHPHHEEF